MYIYITPSRKVNTSWYIYTSIIQGTSPVPKVKVKGGSGDSEPETLQASYLGGFLNHGGSHSYDPSYMGYKQPYGFWVWTQQCGYLSPMFGHGYLSTMKISFNNEHRGFNQFWGIISTFIFWIFLAILMSEHFLETTGSPIKNMSWIIFMNQNLAPG